MVDERDSDMYRSEEKLRQAAASSSYEKFRSDPVGGSGKGPEAYKGLLAAPDLKLPTVFSVPPPLGDGSGKGCGLEVRCSFHDPVLYFESSCPSYSIEANASCSASSRADGADKARILVDLLLVTLLVG
jgi:hypothetical protein